MGDMKRFSLLTVVAAAGVLLAIGPTSIAARTSTTTSTSSRSTTSTSSHSTTSTSTSTPTASSTTSTSTSTTTTAASSASQTLGQTLQLGVTQSPLVAPACPKGVSAADCTIVLTQATALESLRDGIAYPTSVTTSGLIVAWTVGLSRLSNSTKSTHTAIHYLDTTYGGTTQAGISVLAPVGTKSLHRWQVVAESPIVHLQPYLGYVVQFPLATPLQVAAGDVVALTVKTWAPVLSFDLASSQFAYRQSRSANCAKPAGVSQAQLSIGDSARYACNYPGTRVEYGATEVTTPVVPKNEVHARDLRR
jgi:hypothetical protein